MADYPTSAKTYSTKTLGQTIAASHMSDVQDEITAIEQALLNGLAHDLKFTDATYDIGKSGATRPRDGFFSRNFTIGADLTVGDDLAVTDDATIGGDLAVTGTLSAGVSTLASGSFTGQMVAGTPLFLQGLISPTILTANANDYAPTSFATATTLALSSDASRDITGLAGGASGRYVLLVNNNANNIVLKNASASSTAANRFACPGNADFTLNQFDAVWIVYLGASWYVLGF